MTGFLKYLPALLLLCVFYAGTSYAACPTFVKISDAAFGAVTDNPTISGPNYVEMGSNGNITCPATATVCPATGTAMSFQIGGCVAGNAIKIDCEATKTFTNNAAGFGSTTLGATAFRVTNTAGRANPGGGSLCSGLGGAGTFTHTYTGVAVNDVIYVDVKLDETHPKFSGTYTLSANAAGNFQISAKKGGVTVTTNGDASISFAANIGITSTTNMNFGQSSFSGVPGAGDRVDLGTNSTVVAAGNFSLEGGTLTAGQVTMNNVQNGVTLQVQCDNTAHLTSADGARSIDVTGIKAAKETAIGTYAAAGSACNGSGGAVATTLVYTAGSEDQFFFGGRLDGATASGITTEVYSSTNPGGTSVVVVVLAQ